MLLLHRTTGLAFGVRSANIDLLYGRALRCSCSIAVKLIMLSQGKRTERTSGKRDWIINMAAEIREVGSEAGAQREEVNWGFRGLKLEVRGEWWRRLELCRQTLLKFKRIIRSTW